MGTPTETIAVTNIEPATMAHHAITATGATLAGLGAAAATSSVALAIPAIGGIPTIDMTPENFRPVCPASDRFYGLGKNFADALLGAEGAEYRPLAIEALLRVRLEVCVLESFVYEAIVPFVQRKGVGWILPLHETLDTVIAGTVFAVAINFILFGTTKILAVLSIYHDFLVGAPLRLIGFSVFPEKKVKEVPFIQINWPGKPPPETAKEEDEPPPGPPPALPVAVFGGFCKGYGVVAEILKNFLEGLDTFVGRYLVLVSITYVLFKWAHFRLFNDFPPF